MALAGLAELLAPAHAAGYAVAAFNVIGLEHAEAIVRGAELERSPVILQLSQNAVRYHFGQVEPIGAACRELAGLATVPVALHLDHATEEDLCVRAVAVGFGSVMLDAQGSPEETIHRVADLVVWARARGVAVEGALGVVGGKEGQETTEDGMTDPEAAKEYAERTGVAALAVAIGTTHGMVAQTARLDLDRLAALRAVVPVPLVLHGSSGVPDALLTEAARLGVAKVNLATQLNKAFTAAIRRELAADPEVVDPRRYVAPAREAVIQAVRGKLRILGSAGTA